MTKSTQGHKTRGFMKISNYRFVAVFSLVGFYSNSLFAVDVNSVTQPIKQKQQILKELDLSFKSLTQLVKILTQTDQVEALRLCCVDFSGAKNEQIIALTKELTRCQLKKLTLSNTGITPKQLAIILSGLQKSLKGFELCGADFFDATEEQIAAFVQAFSGSKLKNLNLGGSWIAASHLVKILFVLQQTLEELNLGNIDFEDVSENEIRSLTLVLARCKLKYLNLDGSYSTTSQLVKILFALQQTLEELNLGRLDFSTASAEEVRSLVKAFARYKLKKLTFIRADITPGCLAKFLSAFHETLEELDLSEIDFSNSNKEEILSLAKVFSGSKLEKLNLSWAIIAPEHIKTIVLGLQPTLKYLDLSGIEFSGAKPEQLEKLADAIAGCQSINGFLLSSEQSEIGSMVNNKRRANGIPVFEEVRYPLFQNNPSNLVPNYKIE